MFTFEKYHNLIDKLAAAAKHTANAIATGTSGTAAAIIVLVSAAPEYLGVYATSGSHALAMATASVSVVGVGVSMRKFDQADPRTWLWLAPYGAQLFLSLAIIKLHGGGVELCYPWLSLIGAIYATAGVEEAHEGEQAKRQQSREDQLFDLELEKKKAMDAITIANRRLQQAAKFGVTTDVDSAQPEPNITPNVRQKSAATITEEQAKAGQEASYKARRTAAQQRQAELFRVVVDNYAGHDVGDLNKTALGKALGVSAATIKRDIEALRSAGRLNGQVPEGV